MTKELDNRMLCHFANCNVSRILLLVLDYLKLNTDFKIKGLLFNLSKVIENFAELLIIIIIFRIEKSYSLLHIKVTY